MPSTYEPIATQTLGSGASSVTFSSIPNTYTDLVLVCNFATSLNATAGVYIQFNGNTGSDYSVTNLIGDGSTASSSRTSNATFFRIAGSGVGTSSAFDNTALINVMNYSNSTTFKTTVFRSGQASRSTMSGIGLYRSTSVISSLVLTGETQNISTGSTFTLYGIKAA